ncbi:MAG: hypothetical protein PVH63_01655 [Balneolaceae bacterium]|jgi:hypothetical protein
MNKVHFLFYAVLMSFILGLTTSLRAQSISQTINGFSHPESVVATGDYLYVSNIGVEMQATAKDGDGFISKINKKTGAIEQLHFLPTKEDTLNAPKGLVIVNNTLYTADVDRVVGFDLTNRKEVFSITIPETSFLNDIAVKDDQTLFVSATDIGKIARVDIDSHSYRFLQIPTVTGANGLTFSTNMSQLYCVGFGSENKPNGNITSITLNPLTPEIMNSYQGYLDGAAYYEGKLYFSDWKSFDREGVINTFDPASGTLAPLNLERAIGGPADFYLDPSTRNLYLPAMLENKLITIKLKH